MQTSFNKKYYDLLRHEEAKHRAKMFLKRSENATGNDKKALSGPANTDALLCTTLSNREFDVSGALADRSNKKKKLGGIGAGGALLPAPLLKPAKAHKLKNVGPGANEAFIDPSEGFPKILDPVAVLHLKPISILGIRELSFCDKNITGLHHNFLLFENLEVLFLKRNRLRTITNLVEPGSRLNPVVGKAEGMEDAAALPPPREGALRSSSAAAASRGPRRLRHLDVSFNLIHDLSTTDIPNLPFLEHLQLGGNRLQDIQHVASILRRLRFLHSLVLARNPIASLEGYRLYMIHHIPQLVTLDQRTIQEEERQAASSLYPLPGTRRHAERGGSDFDASGSFTREPGNTFIQLKGWGNLMSFPSTGMRGKLTRGAEGGKKLERVGGAGGDDQRGHRLPKRREKGHGTHLGPSVPTAPPHATPLGRDSPNPASSLLSPTKRGGEEEDEEGWRNGWKDNTAAERPRRTSPPSSCFPLGRRGKKHKLWEPSVCVRLMEKKRLAYLRQQEVEGKRVEQEEEERRDQVRRVHLGFHGIWALCAPQMPLSQEEYTTWCEQGKRKGTTDGGGTAEEELQDHAIGGGGGVSSPGMPGGGAGWRARSKTMAATSHAAPPLSSLPTPPPPPTAASSHSSGNGEAFLLPMQRLLSLVPLHVWAEEGHGRGGEEEGTGSRPTSRATSVESSGSRLGRKRKEKGTTENTSGGEGAVAAKPWMELALEKCNPHSTRPRSPITEKHHQSVLFDALLRHEGALERKVPHSRPDWPEKCIPSQERLEKMREVIQAAGEVFNDLPTSLSLRVAALQGQGMSGSLLGTGNPMATTLLTGAGGMPAVFPTAGEPGMGGGGATGAGKAGGGVTKGGIAVAGGPAGPSVSPESGTGGGAGGGRVTLPPPSVVASPTTTAAVAALPPLSMDVELLRYLQAHRSALVPPPWEHIPLDHQPLQALQAELQTYYLRMVRVFFTPEELHTLEAQFGTAEVLHALHQGYGSVGSLGSGYTLRMGSGSGNSGLLGAGGLLGVGGAGGATMMTAGGGSGAVGGNMVPSAGAVASTPSGGGERGSGANASKKQRAAGKRGRAAPTGSGSSFTPQLIQEHQLLRLMTSPMVMSRWNRPWGSVDSLLVFAPSHGNGGGAGGGVAGLGGGGGVGGAGGGGATGMTAAPAGTSSRTTGGATGKGGGGSGGASAVPQAPTAVNTTTSGVVGPYTSRNISLVLNLLREDSHACELSPDHLLDAIGQAHGVELYASAAGGAGMMGARRSIYRTGSLVGISGEGGSTTPGSWPTLLAGTTAGNLGRGPVPPSNSGNTGTAQLVSSMGTTATGNGKPGGPPSYTTGSNPNPATTTTNPSSSTNRKRAVVIKNSSGNSGGNEGGGGGNSHGMSGGTGTAMPSGATEGMLPGSSLANTGVSPPGNAAPLSTPPPSHAAAPGEKVFLSINNVLGALLGYLPFIQSRIAFFQEQCLRCATSRNQQEEATEWFVRKQQAEMHLERLQEAIQKSKESMERREKTGSRGSRKSKKRLGSGRKRLTIRVGAGRASSGGDSGRGEGRLSETPSKIGSREGRIPSRPFTSTSAGMGVGWEGTALATAAFRGTPEAPSVGASTSALPPVSHPSKDRRASVGGNSGSMPSKNPKEWPGLFMESMSLLETHPNLSLAWQSWQEVLAKGVIDTNRVIIPPIVMAGKLVEHVGQCLETPQVRKHLISFRKNKVDVLEEDSDDSDSL